MASLKALSSRLEKVEKSLSVGVVTITTDSGSVVRVPENRIFRLFAEASRLSQNYHGDEVPDSALVDNPVLLSVKHMQQSTEDGALLELARISLLPPAGPPPPDYDRSI